MSFNRSQLLDMYTRNESITVSTKLKQADINTQYNMREETYLEVTIVMSCRECGVRHVVMVNVDGVWGRLLLELNTETHKEATYYRHGI